jgi:hypothetical protein
MHQNLVILYSIALKVQLHKMEEIISVQKKFYLLKNEYDYSECDVVEPGTATT